MSQKLIMSWSGGKDSSITLYELQKQTGLEIVSLLTNFTEGYDRITMHGVRRELLEKQVEHLGYSLTKIYTSQKSSNEEYEAKMSEVFKAFSEKGIDTVVYGDIFLEDLKIYREKMLAANAMNGFYPIWKRDTKALVTEFIDLGFKAVLTCIKSSLLDKSFAGRQIDKDLLKDLPENVDPCGENGEFHSFVYDGPIFSKPVKIEKGEVVTRGPFHYCDFLLK